MSRLHIKALCYQGRGPFNLTVQAGQCVGLSGISGSGKTLMLRAIADLDTHSGHVFLDDAECQTMQAPQWRKQVGLLPTESQWWHDTAGENFTSAVELTLLKRLGFDEDALSWQVSRLSSGERQRLALARLLSSRPQALLLDEPTASLDSANIQNAETLIVEYRRDTGAAVLWVSHDMEQIARVAERHFQIHHEALKEQII
ncbi:ATP-binding cassette domain-containing protein [Desulfococcaceae bacterium HSG9]|nr:ATP-binding cassette domain-containing protein [Desulfococcaceae bacterium HSG9]